MLEVIIWFFQAAIALRPQAVSILASMSKCFPFTMNLSEWSDNAAVEGITATKRVEARCFHSNSSMIAAYSSLLGIR